MLKHLFDIAFATLALCILSPAMLVIAIAVMSSLPGPILFRQWAVGQFRSVFEILKFRTMRAVSPTSESQVTVGADPRITRAGHFLSQWKLDELPQLIDVLNGDMSIVGPRPEVERYAALYLDADRQFIQAVQPGITDRASIVDCNEAELLAQQADPESFYASMILSRKLSTRVKYAQNHSFAGDIRILYDTVVVIAFAKARGTKSTL